MSPVDTKKEHVKLNALSLEQIRNRTTSLMWDTEYDPFQVFEVEHESCLDLQIEVHKGENVTKGSYVKDMMDTPDPYVILRIPGSSNSAQRTSHVDNCVNPLWNTTFHFFLDPKQEHILHVILMDANYTVDETLGDEEFCVNCLTNDVPYEHVFAFPGGSKVFTTLTLQKNKKPDLRFSLALCDEEKDFLRTRREKVLRNMQNVLQQRAPKSIDEVPVVGVLGSGGGFRAMVCMGGVVKALHEAGILGCTTFISGLSGSSWFISTLYSSATFPCVSYEDVLRDLRRAVTEGWKANLFHLHSYVRDMLDKHRKGQPVSFTDFFGHLLGDVLLRGRSNIRLSDQRRIVRLGVVPFPLYTCLHAKDDVSCRTFSEWVEFSPFEIGIAKYGTFMNTKHFGSKFLVGKLIKVFDEFPLHYLQGVWGSAFTILVKRLVMDRSCKQDMVQMMREANEEMMGKEQEERSIQEKLEDNTLADRRRGSGVKESDTDDEGEIVGKDDDDNDEDGLMDDTVNMADTTDNISNNTKAIHVDETDKHGKQDLSIALCNIPQGSLSNECEGKEVGENGVITIAMDCNTLNRPNGKKSPKKGSSPNLLKKDIFLKAFKSSKKPIEKSDQVDACYEKMHKSVSLDIPAGKTLAQRSERSKSDDVAGIKVTATSARLVRQNAIRSTKKANPWAHKRKEHQTKREKKSSLVQSLLANSNLMNSRAYRAGEILNPFRGLSLRQSFPVSPFSYEGEILSEEDDEEAGDSGRYEPLDNTAKRLFVVDSGLAFNSPYPLLLRPQRAVNIYLSFDFSQRPKDKDPPFKELLLAEKWAIENKVPFPPVKKQAEEYLKDTEVKELYVFKSPTDQTCPVILHFPIVNNKFRKYSAPGVRRETDEEFDFADFSLFNDPKQPFASTNFIYEEQNFNRLVQLMEFNTRLNIETIKDEIADAVERKRRLADEMTHPKAVASRVARVWNSQIKRRSNVKSSVTSQLSLKINEEELNKYEMFGKHWLVKSKISRVKNTSECSSDGTEEFYDASEDIAELEEEQNDQYTKL